MMTRTMTLFMVISLLFFGAIAGALELNEGISKYRWGESVSKKAGLTLVGENGEVSYYSKPGETFTISDVSIEKVIYGFYQDQLFGVYLNIESTEVYDKLLAHMKSLYGLPAMKSKVGNLLVFQWKVNDVTIKLKINEPTQKMKLAFYYRPLSRELNAQHLDELDTSSFHFVPIEKDKRPEKFVLFKF